MAMIRSLGATAISTLITSDRSPPTRAIPLIDNDSAAPCGCGSAQPAACSCWSDLAKSWLDSPDLDDAATGDASP